MIKRIDNPPISVLAQCRDDNGRPLRVGLSMRGLMFRQLMTARYSAALYNNERLVAVVGVSDFQDVVDLWFMPGPAISDSPLASYRAGQDLMRHIKSSFKAVLAFVRTDVPDGRRLAALFGFKATGETGQLGHVPYEVFKHEG